MKLITTDVTIHTVILDSGITKTYVHQGTVPCGGNGHNGRSTLIGWP